MKRRKVYNTQNNRTHQMRPSPQAQKVKTKGNFTNQGEIILAPQIVPGMVQTYIDAGEGCTYVH